MARGWVLVVVTLTALACGGGSDDADDHGHDHAANDDHADHATSEPGHDDHAHADEHDHEDPAHRDPKRTDEHDHGDDDHDHGDDGSIGGEQPHDDHGHDHGGAWSLTAWGERAEVFLETEPLIVGRPVVVLTHVTRLADFGAPDRGSVTVVLRAGRRFMAFPAEAPVRDGIWAIELTPPAEGRYLMSILIEAGGLTEEVPGAVVTVGSEDHPGGLVGRPPEEGEVAFLKEVQWRTAFATAWARDGGIHEVVRGTGHVRPAAGGESLVTATLDGILLSTPWPHPGLPVTEGEAVFAMRSRASEGRTLASLEAVETERAGELQLARDRLGRLEELLPAQAVSEADVEVAGARVRALEAQLAAARRDLAAVRGGGDGGDRVILSAPFSGKVADVRVSPGEAVSSGQVLGRLVAVEPVWVNVHLAARDAARLGHDLERLWLRAAGQREPVRFDSVRMIAVSPAVDDRTGRVECLLEIPRVPEDLRIGSAVEAEITGADVHEGVVIPVSAVVDDAGTPVVYVQRTGESFSRVVVEVLGREGGRLLVRGVSDGDRVVTMGGNAIRRASLVGSGVGHGHVH